ncbi:MAG: nucleotidyltransferase family protein [Patescibacteria group bacterium]|nr:nucleotidyltransferase family protein [Patescibacteria group bacterium]
MPEMIDMRAIILVGGEATRLRPLTLTTPKALIPLQGRPILEHVLDLFKEHDLTDIVLSIGYKKEQIREYFGDGKRFGLSISYVEEPSPLGTAGFVHLLERPIDETCIVCNGDELKDIDIPAMLAAHRQTGALATLALLKVDDPSPYGVARLDGTKILEFVEKPKREEAPSHYVNAGFYLLEPEVFTAIPRGRVMFEYDVFPRLAAAGKLHGFFFAGRWYDTGTPERLSRAEREWPGVPHRAARKKK